MKGLFTILILFFLCFVSVPAFVQGATFEQGRTVMVLPPERRDSIGQYMYYRAIQPFRLPYYDLLSSPETVPSIWNESTFQQLAETYHADIIIGPIVKDFDQWPMSHPTYDGDIVTRVRTYYDLRLLVYDRRSQTFQEYRTRYVNTEEESVLTSAQAMMEQGMDSLMKKLPYKRIPTDVPRISPDDQFYT